jgi:hypothetical protein
MASVTDPTSSAHKIGAPVIEAQHPKAAEEKGGWADTTYKVIDWGVSLAFAAVLVVDGLKMRENFKKIDERTTKLSEEPYGMDECIAELFDGTIAVGPVARKIREFVK